MCKLEWGAGMRGGRGYKGLRRVGGRAVWQNLGDVSRAIGVAAARRVVMLRRAVFAEAATAPRSSSAISCTQSGSLGEGSKIQEVWEKGM